MIGAVAFWLVTVVGGVWGGLFLWVQLPQQRWLALPIWLLVLAGVAVLRWRTSWGWVALLLALLVVVGWFFLLKPRQQDAWAPDVARIVRGQVSGDLVTLENVRDFRWQSADHAVERWHSRHLDLSRLVGADVITSVWGNPLIAHVLVSFRFSDQDPVTFSVEIRRREGEKFSALGGFFRQFAQSLIAAEEADIVQWRAGPRGEEVRLYPLDLPPEVLRTAFLAFVDFGNQLNAQPQWYNTATANCASVAWYLARAAAPGMPLDLSLLLPGLVPEYLERLGVLAGGGDLQRMKARALISDLVPGLDPDAGFSAAIRQRQ